MKRVLAMVLLTGVVVVNTAIFCQSLCMADRHKGISSHDHAAHNHQNVPEQKMPNGEMCPVTHADHATHHMVPQTFLKCGCSADENASSVPETTLLKSLHDFMPHLEVISRVTLSNSIFSSREPIPLEAPPNLLS